MTSGDITPLVDCTVLANLIYSLGKSKEGAGGAEVGVPGSPPVTMTSLSLTRVRIVEHSTYTQRKHN